MDYRKKQVKTNQISMKGIKNGVRLNIKDAKINMDCKAVKINNGTIK